MMRIEKGLGSLSFIMMAAFLAACGGNDTAARLDGDATAAEFQIRASSPASVARMASRSLAATGIEIPSEGITITSAQVNVERVKLELPVGLTCDDVTFEATDTVSCETEMELEDGVEEMEAEITILGPIVFDLLTGESSPALSELEIPSGEYREIEIKLGVADERTDDMSENSLFVSGSYTDGVDVIPFELALEIEEEFEIESVNALEVFEDQLNTMIAEMNVEAWFTGLGLGECLASGSYPLDAAGDLVIRDDDDLEGSDACQTFEEDLEENIKNSFEFEDDDEEDDSIEDPEDDSV